MRNSPLIVAICLGALLVSTLLPIRASAATLTVTNLADSGPGSLRSAIASSASGDIILIATNGVITLTAELTITTNLTITGPGATSLVISGNYSNRVFYISSTNSTVSISGLTIAYGRAETGGTGGNGQYASPGGNGGNGAGVYNVGKVTLIGCTLYANTAGLGGTGGTGSGGIFGTGYSGNGGNGGYGGGIANFGTLTLINCTMNNNAGGAGGTGGLSSTYVYGGNGGNGGEGGAIYNAGTLAITNCTLGANAPGYSGSGGGGPHYGLQGSVGRTGGLYDSGQTTLIASTINGNSGYGVLAFSSPPVLRNVLIAQNNSGSPDLANNAFNSQGHNLIGNGDSTYGFTNGINGDQVGTTATPLNPQLGPLANNGGMTLTFALQPGSPALEAGDDALTGAPFNLATDQRGFPRKSGLHVDIGAFEHDVTTWPAISVTTLNATNGASSPVTGTGPVTFNGSINPGGLIGTAYFQYGVTTNYGGVLPVTWTNFGTNVVAVNTLANGLGAGIIYHYRLLATNNDGLFAGNDQAFMVPSLYVPGDLDGDGVVDQNDLNAVLSNYWPHSPWLLMTNVAGLGTTNVQFALPYPTAWNFTVEVSTNLASWSAIGSAYPLYQFGDAAATNVPQRYYRLRYP